MTSSDGTSSTALVTGASRGFGRAIASALHAEGAKVVAVARNAELLASLRHELGGTLTTEAADVTIRSRVSSNTRLDEYARLVAHAIGAASRQPIPRALERALTRRR